MKNLEIREEGNKIIITVLDKNKTFGASSTGKTIIVASSEGNQNIAGVFIGVNVYKK